MQLEIETDEGHPGSSGKDADAFLYTRDEVLRFIKNFLQPYYESGSLKRGHFILLAKRTLLFAMSSGDLGARRYSKAFVKQLVQLQLEQIDNMKSKVAPLHTNVSHASVGVWKSAAHSNEVENVAVHKSLFPIQTKTPPQPYDSSSGGDTDHAMRPQQRMDSSISRVTPSSVPPYAQAKSNGCSQAHRYYYASPFPRHPILPSRSSSNDLQQQCQHEQQKRQCPQRKSDREKVNIEQHTQEEYSESEYREDSAEGQWCDEKDGALLEVVRHLQARLAAAKVSCSPNGPQSVPTTPTTPTTPASTCAAAATEGERAVMVIDREPSYEAFGLADFVQVADVRILQYGKRLDLLAQWAFERQELMRVEGQDFTLLLLRLQQTLISGLAQRVSDGAQKRDDKEASEGSPNAVRHCVQLAQRTQQQPPPPPTTPPPRVQFVCFPDPEFSDIKAEKHEDNDNESKKSVSIQVRMESKGVLSDGETTRTPKRRVTTSYLSRFLHSTPRPSQSTDPTLPSHYVKCHHTPKARAAKSCTPQRSASCGLNTSPRVRSRSVSSQTHRIPSKAVTSLQRVDRSDIVEYLRELLQPAFSSGTLPMERLADIVQQATRGVFGDAKRPQLPNGVVWRKLLRERVAQLIGETLIMKE